MHSGPGRGFPVVYVVGRDEVLTVLYSRTDWYKVRAPRGSRRMGAPRRIWRAPNSLRGSRRRYRPIRIFRLTAGRWGPATGSTTGRTWSPPMSTMGSPTASTSRRCCSRRSARSTIAYIASIGLRHTFIPEWKWFSPTAGLGTAYQHIEDKVPPAPLENNNQMAYVVARCTRIHHPTLHVARRLAPLRRLQQPERVRGSGRMEIRLSSVLLAAALLAGCSWFHRGDKKPTPGVRGGAAGGAHDHRAAGVAPRGEDAEDQVEGLRGGGVLRRA